MKVIAFIAIIFLMQGSASAAVINAASCSQAHVQAAVNTAGSGDTVSVPAGNCTWSSEITLSKDISVIGAGSANTKITMTGTCFALDLGYTTRVSGFGFTNCTVSGTGLPAAGKTFRIDHNAFTSTTWQDNSFHGGCQNPQRHPTGLIDNNTFHNYRVAVVAGSNCMLNEGNYQHQLWAEAPPMASGTGIVYMEDNAISSTEGVHQNWVDGNYGGRYVGRFNTINGNTYIEVHSVQGANRAVQWWEFYKNTQTKPAESWYPFGYIRGGSGMVWGNRVSSNYTNDFIMNNVRSCRDPGDGNGKCAGSSNWDQNTPALSGYACRDQIGRSRDNVQWAPGSAYAQNLTPAYFWDNIKGANTPLALNIDPGEACPGTGGDLNPVHLVENRDWYTQNTSFNGTSGVGVGTLLNRPSTCTVGIAYWAIDQGEWNSKQAGPDGQLYKCTSTNTWSLYYVPYPYPHPLQGVGSILYGDVSENSSVTAYDASLAAQYAVGSITLTSAQITKADVSGNGSVTSYDASLIAQYAVGLITKFPVQG